MNEYQFVQSLRGECRRQKIKTYKLSTGVGEKGAPDIMGVYRSIPFFIEAKYGDKHGTSAKQKYELEAWMEHGAIAIVINGAYTTVFNIVTALRDTINALHEEKFLYASGQEKTALFIRRLMEMNTK